MVGFIASTPIAGPIAALLFARSIDGRYRSAFYIGLGSVLPEAAYAFLAFWGFSKLLADHAWIVPVSDGAAAAILLVLGITFLRRKRDADAPERDAEGLAGSFVLGFTISALNPTLIATFTGVVTMLFSTGWVKFEPALALPFGLGTAAGVFAWYVTLIQLVRHYKKGFNREKLNRVIRFFGFFVLGISGWFLWRLIDHLTSM